MSSSRRSSAELSSNLTGSETKQRSSHIKLSKSVIAQLQKVAEQEEKELFLYSVREELMKRVMDEIYRRYLERQSIKFTVDCAYKALVQVLQTEFLVHDKVTQEEGCPFYESHPDWAADTEPQPSAPDSWAAHNVKIRPKPQLKEILSSDLPHTGVENEENLKVLYVKKDSAGKEKKVL